MANRYINIEIDSIGAINNANIILDGITVIAGENGSGKSTVSKFAYQLFQTSIEFDKIVDSKLRDKITQVYQVLDPLTMELSYFLSKDEYLKIRSSFRRFLRNKRQLSLFGEDDDVFVVIEYLIELFSDPERELKDSRHLDRIRVLLREFLDEKNEINDDIVHLLATLKLTISEYLKNSSEDKESRPISILNEKIHDAFIDFEDFLLSKSYNVTEYGVSIIDREEGKVLPIHSIHKTAYIDTPMIIGLDMFSGRNHWDDINELISYKGNRTDNKLDSVFKKDILKGDVDVEDSEFMKSFRYKRNDGEEFDLLECATGLKSFSILQLLYKNGFFSKQTLLIIDEPEVHLHPQWVVEYARLIVLLNKYIGVKFLIASHHPDMISAIKYISEKEEVASSLNFYLAEKLPNTFVYDYKHLGSSIDDIFSSFNIALDRIDLYGRTE